MEVTWWTGWTAAADILFIQVESVSAQTQVGAFFPVNNGHTMNSLSVYSKHWDTNRDGNRVGYSGGDDSGVVLWADKITGELWVTSAILKSSGLGIVLTTVSRKEQGFVPRTK